MNKNKDAEELMTEHTDKIHDIFRGYVNSSNLYKSEYRKAKDAMKRSLDIWYQSGKTKLPKELEPIMDYFNIEVVEQTCGHCAKKCNNEWCVTEDE